MRILAVDPLRPGSDNDSHIWGTTQLRERFPDGRIDTTGEYLLGTRCASQETLADDIRPGDDTQMLVTADGENGTPCASQDTLTDNIRPGDDTQMLVSGDGENGTELDVVLTDLLAFPCLSLSVSIEAPHST
ncbi:hypothetical protein MTO96_039628 [Rhipicephalus appendiculatus]